MSNHHVDLSKQKSPQSRNNGLYYGWIVVIALLISSTILYGTVQSFGVFFKSIENAYNLTRTMTSAVVSINWFISGAAAFITGRALDKYGPKTVVFLMGLFTGLSLILTGQTNSPWQLFITYGLLLPFGTGAVYVVLTSAVSRWFDKRRGLALGVTGAGSGLGTIIMVPLTTYLVTQLDWRTAYVILGLIALAVIIPFSRLLRREPSEVRGSNEIKLNLQYSESEYKNANQKNFSLSQVISTRDFWLILFIWMLFGSCLLFIFTHLVPHITDIGFSPIEAAGVLSVFGVASITGRVLIGAVADRIGRKLTSVVAILLQAGAMFWLVGSQELWMFYVFAVIFGCAYSGFSASMGALIGDVFGLARIGSIFGVLEIGFSIGAAAGPAIGGLIFDHSGSYFTAFLVLGFSMLIISLLVGLLGVQRTPKDILP